MIKKYNEEWNSFSDFLDEEKNKRSSKIDDDWTKNKWREYWDKMSRDVNNEMDTIAMYAKQHAMSYEDAKKEMSASDTKFKVGDRVMDIDFKTDGEIIQIKEGGVRGSETQYLVKYDDDGSNGWSSEDELVLSKPKKPIVFEDGFEVVGLPSGQIIYMNSKQIEYFKARNAISFKGTYKKPVDTGELIVMRLDKYCFSDKSYDDIKEMMDAITW